MPNFNDIFQNYKWLIITIIVIVIFIVVIVIIGIISIIFINKSKKKENFTTALNENKNLSDGSDPLHNYIYSWIKSVKALYSAKPINENYVESRTMKNFNMYTYLDKNPIVTGVNKY